MLQARLRTLESQLREAHATRGGSAESTPGAMSSADDVARLTRQVTDLREQLGALFRSSSGMRCPAPSSRFP